MTNAYTVATLTDMSDGRLITGNPEGLVTGFAYDSRHVANGQCFVALPGERVDGHDYAAAAARAGAAAVLVARPVALPGSQVAQILVRDPLLALGQVAALHRTEFAGQVVAITGSVGKTTTKEMTASILSQRFATMRNTGNLNSEVGLPIMLLNGLHGGLEVAVLEMGMRARGEIAYLASIARPQVAVVTNVGTTHLEWLGSIDNIARAKAELVQSLPPTGVAVLNAGDPRVAAMGRLVNGSIIAYGLNREAVSTLGRDGWATLVNPRFTGDSGQEFTLVTSGGSAQVTLPVPGQHMALTALAAAGAGLAMGLDPAEIAAGLGSFVPTGRRMRLHTQGGVRILDDSYNAAPASMLAALASARELAGAGRLWAVLGDMFELGALAVASHREVGRAAGAVCNEVLAVGEMALHISDAASSAGLGVHARHFTSKELLGVYLLERLAPGDTVLIKGSRGMQMEDIVTLIENHLSRLPGGGVSGP